MKRFFVRVSLIACLIAPHTLPAQQPELHWIGTWAAAPLGSRVNYAQPAPGNSTYRDIVHISMGGSPLRVELTNEFGARPLTVGGAHIAVSAGPQGAIQPASDHALRFSGQAAVTIPAGGLVVSDPVSMRVAPLADLAVSIYLPDQPINDTTCHADGQSTNFIATGNTTTAETLNDSRPIYSWCFLKGIDVGARESNAAAIVCFGDSITDGWASTRDANRRWPDVLARRLQADPNTAHLAILNEGIGGNRLLHDGAGPNAIARFDRDVLAQTGVRFVILLEGINDIGHITEPRDPSDIIGAQDEIFALSQLAARAHSHGLRVIGATITPFIGASYASPAGEQIREAVNQWIRTSSLFDAVIDFDQITRDPANPTTFAPALDSGDHLHPGDAGYERMGSSIDLALFR